MSEGPETVVVSLGNMNLRVPIYGSRSETIKLADRVNERLRAIEDRSERIDTQAFALEAALFFAAEAEQLRRAIEKAHEETETEIQEMTKAVSALNSALEEVVSALE